MSNKKNIIYTKILIDLDEYIKLLHIQERVNKQEDLINARLQKDLSSSSKPKDNFVDNPIASTSKDNSKNNLNESQNSAEPKNSQSGYGSESDLIKHITELVTQQIQSHLQSSPQTIFFQEGKGANDLISEIPDPIVEDPLNPDLQPPSIVIQKSQPHDNFDDERLINSVPSKFRERAKKLIEKLAPFKSDLTWDASGTIFLDQESLPSSNIFKTFPFLFERKPTSNIYPNLLEIVTKIASLGLGHFINKRLTLGLLRKKAIEDQDKIHEQIKNAKHWWYLGP